MIAAVSNAGKGMTYRQHHRVSSQLAASAISARILGKVGLSGLSSHEPAIAGSSPTETRQRMAQLIARVANDADKQAFVELFLFFGPRVKRYLVRLGANTELADELAQDVMMQVWRKAALFEAAKSAPTTWIFRIARNRWIDEMRRSANGRIDTAQVLLLMEATNQPAIHVEASGDEELVRRALVSLPPEAFDLLILAFYEGLSHSEIAARTGAPLGTVKSRIRAAIRALRAKIGHERLEDMS
jgi:RNA polymerase sigma-70 factor (ECF subfamily)